MLEQAKAKYDKTKERLLYACGFGDLQGIADEQAALDAAVKDLVLAVEQLGQDGMRHSEIVAEIERVFSGVTS